MLKSPAAVRGVQLERPDVVRRLPAPCWRHAGHAPATLCLVRPCCAINFDQHASSATCDQNDCFMHDIMQNFAYFT